MLNLVKKNKIINLYKKYDKIKTIKSSKHFPSSTREWKDSLFYYNKNNINLTPAAHVSSMNIIKNYFSLFNENIEKNVRTRYLNIERRKLSMNKIYISDGEFKHTNDNVIINLYVFNKQNNNFKWIMHVIKSQLFFNLARSKKILLKRLYFLKRASIYRLNIKKLYLIKKVKKIQKNKRINSYINFYLEKYFKNILDIEKKKRLLYFYYKKVSFLNKSKFTYTYLQHLKEHLNKIHNKRIEFNIINLKRFFLNSDILSEIIAKKISNKRKKTKRLLKNLKKKIVVIKIKKQINKKQNLSLIKLITKSLKYKYLTGFRLQAKGRLTKRFAAARAISMLKYKGNLLNRDSSLKGLSSVLLKGNLKSNVQYSKVTSKSNIGSFGIKGWISGN